MTNLELARLFHDSYERLAPLFGYETRALTRVFDPESSNGELMLAVINEVRNHLVAREEPGCPECARLRNDRDKAAAASPRPFWHECLHLIGWVRDANYVCRLCAPDEPGGELCPHGMPLAEHICGPCSQGRPNRGATHWLGELLAIIHCDGGHYQARHGTEKAVADAIEKWNSFPRASAENRSAANNEEKP